MPCLSILFTMLGFLWAIPVLAQSGEVRISSEPGVAVYIDETFMGLTTQQEGGKILLGFPAGDHTLKAVKPGYAPFILPFRVLPGRAVILMVSGPWTPAPPDSPLAERPTRRPLAPPGWRAKDRSPFHDVGPQKRGLIRKTVSLFLPVISKPTESWKGAHTGVGFEMGVCVHRMVSLSAYLLNGFRSLGDINENWFAFDVGVKLHFGPPKARLILRPGFVASHVSGHHNRTSFYSVGGGISLAGGPEFRFSPYLGMGFTFGMHYLIFPHQGEEETWVPTGSYQWGTEWVDVESRLSLFTAIYLLFLW
jgi:hypothetical protein